MENHRPAGHKNSAKQTIQGVLLNPAQDTISGP